MKKLLYAALVVGLIVIIAQSAFTAQTTTAKRTVKQTGMPGVVSVMTTKETVQIVAVDQKKRMVTLKTSDGDMGTYKVSKEVRNLSQVKKGDVLQAMEMEKIAIHARTGKDMPKYKETFTIARAPKGAKPGFIATQKTMITGKVQLVQYDQRKVVITGPAGRSKTFDISPDVPNLKMVKPGDVVVAQYTDTLTINVMTPKK